MLNISAHDCIPQIVLKVNLANGIKVSDSSLIIGKLLIKNGRFIGGISVKYGFLTFTETEICIQYNM